MMNARLQGPCLSVVIPVFNEASTLAEVVQKVLSLDQLLEIIVVDDGSTDRTQEVAGQLAACHPQIRFSQHERNLGKTAALRTGFALTRGDVVIVQDADLEADPAEIPSVIQPIIEGEADVVYGSRFLGRRPTGMSLSTLLGNKMLTFISNALTNLKLTDMETCYKAFRGEIIRNMLIVSSGFGFEVESTAKIAKLGCIVREVPVSYRGRSYQEGKKIGVRDGMQALWLLLRFNLFSTLQSSYRSIPETHSSNGTTARRPRRRAILRREFLILFGFGVLTVIMTWPWVTHLRDAVSDPGDPYLNSWILWWDYHQTFHDPLNLFHANIFYPYRYTLALSEHNYGIALLCFPLFALGLRPLTIQGIATLLGFALCGYGMFRLTRTLTACNGAALVAGITFAFIPYRFGQLPHLNYLFAGWIPLLLEALVLFARERTWRRAAWLGTAFLMNGLTCVHWFVLTLIPLGVSALVLVRRYEAWRDPGFWRRGLTATGLAALALIPFLLPYTYAARMYGFVRSPEEARQYSANLISWFVGDGRNKIWHSLNAAGRVGLTSVFPEKELFPGLTPLLLSLGAVFLRFSKSRNGSERHYSEAFWLGSIWSVIGFFGSLGMNFPFHRFLYYYVPLFRSIRVPARWAMICYLGLALLAGLGAKHLGELLQDRWPKFRPALLFVVITLVLLVEQRAAPLELVQGAPDPDAITLKLTHTAMSGGIVELPSSTAQDNYLYVLRAADHTKPLVTAVSGFSPPIQNQIQSLTENGFIPDEFMDLLDSIPCSYLIVHNRLMNTEHQVGLELFAGKQIAAGRLRFIGDYDYNYLYAIVRNEPNARSEAKLPELVRAAANPSPPEKTSSNHEPANLIDEAEFFTRMQYLGFLGREPEGGGLSFWVEKILACKNEPGCVNQQRAGISAAFFDTKEFQDTGYFIYRVYKATLGRAPTYKELTEDRARLAPGPALDANRNSFLDGWTKRREFVRLYPQGLTSEQFVDALTKQMSTTAGVSLEHRRQTLIDQLNAGGSRTNALRTVAEDPAFSQAEYNRAFVSMQYFAYFQRDPDPAGYEFWVNALDRHAREGNVDMTRAFVNSKEYRARFTGRKTSADSKR